MGCRGWREARAAATASAQATPTMTSTAMSSGGGLSFRQRGRGHIHASTRGYHGDEGTNTTMPDDCNGGQFLPFAAMIHVDTRDGRGGSQRHWWLLINYIIISG